MALEGRADAVFGNIQSELHNKDLSVVNLECPLTKGGLPIHKFGPNLKAHPKAVECIIAGGFNIANLANNHIVDYGSEGLRETIQLLQSNKIKWVGAGLSLSAAQKPLRVQWKGRRIIFLAFAENEFNCADEKTAGASPLDPITNMLQIKKAKAQADIVIALVHGGNEGNPVPSPRIEKTYRAFVDAGASAVIGTHPHVPQGYEIYNNAPIFYSIGNLAFDYTQKPTPKSACVLWSKSYAIRLHFQENNVENIEIVPYKALPENGCLALLKGAELDEFKSYIEFLSRILKDEHEIKKYWDAWCALIGPTYLRQLSLSLPIAFLFSSMRRKNVANHKSLLLARNIMNCQAHNELFGTFLDLVRNNQITTAKEYITRIRALKKGIIPDGSIVLRST